MATLMPPGKMQFFDDNGDPLGNGTVTFYVPNTTTLKNTWQDAGQSILNTNPVQLDSGGFAVIYGSGTYRMVVKDADDNLIYDKETASTPELSVDNIQYYATSVGGAANAITVSAITPSDYSLTLGKTLRFISPLTNTGPTTLNPLALGTVSIRRVTSVGTVPLSGGEIVSGGVYDVLYDGTNYILTNPSQSANPGDGKPYFGDVVPNGFLACFGQAVSRTTFAALFAAIGVYWGVGDGSTTFNLPDMRGRTPFGKDDMGGSAASRITNAVSGIQGATLGAVGGSQATQQHTHVATPTDPGHNHTQNAHNHAITDPTHTHTYTAVQSLNGSGPSGGPNNFAGPVQLGVATGATATGITINNSTPTNNANTTGLTVANADFGAGASQNMPGTAIVNWIIRL